MRVKPTIADIVLIAFLTLGSLTWLGLELFGREDGTVVEIYNEAGLYQRLDLHQDATVHYVATGEQLPATWLWRKLVLRHRARKAR